MSILLQALRKSEKDQNRPEAPDIHADDGSSERTEAIQSGPLAVLLVLALFISGWFVWNQYQAPSGLEPPPVTLAAGEASTNDAPVNTQTSRPDHKTQTPEAAAIASHLEARPRTPVESYKQPDKAVSNVKQASTNQSLPVNEKPAAVQSTTAANNRPAAAKSVEKFKSGVPAPISYWELPDSIRADVPEIKFSVLVYAKQPGDRFVLINGQRLGEGDSPQQGLVVKEIRRDGVIFSYRLYQFLVER
ncbi:MAG: GspB domain-containing protein [Xanthomonadales bacterium]|nr:GspB domain-containing protein [Xanthomonadales bacterium]